MEFYKRLDISRIEISSLFVVHHTKWTIVQRLLPIPCQKRQVKPSSLACVMLRGGDIPNWLRDGVSGSQRNSPARGWANLTTLLVKLSPVSLRGETAS